MIQYIPVETLYDNMEEANADLIVNDGFPKHNFVTMPEDEPGSQGPVPPASQENEQLAIMEQGSPLRQAVDGDKLQIDLNRCRSKML